MRRFLSAAALLLLSAAVALAQSGQAPPNTVWGNWGAARGLHKDNVIPSCPDTGGQHLNYNSGTGLACGNSGGGGGGTMTVGSSPTSGAAVGALFLNNTANVLGALPDVATGSLLCSAGVGTAPSYCSAPTVNGGPITINPTANTTNQGIVVNQTGPASGSQTGPFNYNLITVADIGYALAGAGRDSFDLLQTDSAAFRVNTTASNSGVANETLHYSGIFAMQTATGPAGEYEGLLGSVYNNFANASGHIYGMGSYASQGPSGTLAGMFSHTAEISAQTGSTTGVRSAYTAISEAPVQGGTGDFAFAAAAFNVGHGSPAGFKKILAVANGLFNGGVNSGVDPAGDIIWSDLTNGGPTTVANFCNCSNLNVTGSILAFPAVNLSGSGGLALGGPTGGNKGAGTVNVASNYYVNGVPARQILTAPTTYFASVAGGGNCLSSGSRCTLAVLQALIFGQIDFGGQAVTADLAAGTYTTQFNVQPWVGGGSLRITGAIAPTANITAITNANPAVVSANGHGFTNGQIVSINGVVGMTPNAVDGSINGTFIVAGATANTFQLSGVNTTGWSAYSSGGTTSAITSIISTTGASIRIPSALPGPLQIDNLQLQNSGGLGAIESDSSSTITTSGLIFGAAGNRQIYLGGGRLWMQGPHVINGGALFHVGLSPGAIFIAEAQVISLSGTPAFTDFALIQGQGLALFNSTQFVGAATGSQFSISLNGAIFTNSGGANFLPGTANACNPTSLCTSTGGQYQ
jgi:hypothetical protein